MTTSSSNTIYTGPVLKFSVDQSNSVLELVKSGGIQIDVWGQTLQYAFAAQQSTLTLYFTPVPGTPIVSASYVDAQGNTVVCTQQNGSAMLTLQQPPSPGTSFDIQVAQDSATAAALRSAPAPTARMASSSLVSSATGPTSPKGPGARLQTRLVLTTVEPPPDPDARPTLPRA